MRLHRAMIFVKDLDRMVNFYGETLGLKVIMESLTRAMFALHATPREIAGQIEISSPRKRRETCSAKLTFEVELKKLQGLGVTIIERPWGAFDGVDPEGNIFGIE